MKKLTKNAILKYFIFVFTILINLAIINCSNDINIEESDTIDLVDMGSYYVYQEDILLYKDDPFHSQILDQLLNRTEKGSKAIAGPRKSISALDSTWPNNEMPYYLDESEIEFTDYEKENISIAMKELESYSGVRFIEKDEPGDYVFRIVKTTESGICGNSTIGYSSYARYRFKCSDVGRIQHEILHGLGFWHEQSRNDRENYITINSENIISGKEHNFDVKPYTEIHGVYYDYDSVMHYGPWAFDNNGEKTIETKDEAYDDRLGQRYNLSYLDIFGLIKLYGAPRNPLIVIKHDLPSFSPYAFPWKGEFDRMDVPVKINPSKQGDNSKIITLTIENWGKRTLNINDTRIISSNPEWTVVELPTKRSLEQGESTTFKVKLTLSPDAVEGTLYDANIRISSNSNIDISNSDSRYLFFYLQGRAVEKRDPNQIIVTASSYQGEFIPENTLDGELTPKSRWSSRGVDEWIKYDLGKKRIIDSVDIAFFQGDTKRSKLSIDLSNDNRTWRSVFDGMSKGKTSCFERFELPNQNARYVRINAHGNTRNRWNAYTEVKINTINQLVKNGSFELGSPTPDNWRVKDDNAEVTWERKSHGDKSLKFSSTGMIKPTTQTIEIKKNTRYRLSVWIKVKKGTEGSVVFDTNDIFDNSSQFVVKDTNNGKWKRFVGKFCSRGNRSVTLRMFTNDDFNGTAYFDNVSLIKID